ncbi:MAG: hypothetical protein WCC12_04040, partial [Anaerolineales bacterium]
RKTWLGRVVFLLVVLGFFILPIFRVPEVKIAEVTLEEQEAQSVLDTADRAATTADRAQARAWMLARLGAAWNETDPAQAQSALEESLAAVQQARENEKALWGQSLSVQEAMVGVPIDMEKADLIAVDLNAARARAWSLPLIAMEWNKVDPARAAQLLQAEQLLVESQIGYYRDLQLRAVALAWWQVEPSKALPVAGAIDDPAVRAWTLRELVAFDLAAEAARLVEDPVQQARALREVGVASQDVSLFDEALVALEGVTDAPLAYALSDMAAASGDPSLLKRIYPMYSDAHTAALLRLGDYSTAWATSAVSDDYERGRARAAIAKAGLDGSAVVKIDVPLYRDLALRDIIRETRNAALADSIQSPYYRVQAWTALGDYEQAIEAAEDLDDSYPLIELVDALARDDPQAALALVDRMTRESDKAVALQIIAAATNDEALFEQALGMALAARVRGDSLSPAQASLDLANALWSIDPVKAEAALRQASEAAQRISTK